MKTDADPKHWKMRIFYSNHFLLFGTNTHRPKEKKFTDAPRRKKLKTLQRWWKFLMHKNERRKKNAKKNECQDTKREGTDKQKDMKKPPSIHLKPNLDGVSKVHCLASISWFVSMAVVRISWTMMAIQWQDSGRPGWAMLCKSRTKRGELEHFSLAPDIRPFPIFCVQPGTGTRNTGCTEESGLC